MAENLVKRKITAKRINAPKGTSKSRESPTGTKLLLYAVGLLVFIFPVVKLIQMSLTAEEAWSFTNYTRLFSEARTWTAILNTVNISFSATAISVLFGTVLAVGIAYTNVKRKKLLEMLVLMPYIIPAYVITLSWSNVFANNGLFNSLMRDMGLPVITLFNRTGIAFVIGLCNIPLVYLITVNMLRKIPRDLEWAARASGYTRWQTLWKINLVQARPAIISGSILAFLATIDNFSVPAFLGIPSGTTVLSTYIYEKAIGFGPGSFNSAAALSVLLSAIALLGIGLQSIFVKKSSHLESIDLDYSERIILSEKSRSLFGNGLLLFLLFINVIPLLSMVTSSFKSGYVSGWSMENFDVENYSFIFSNPGILSAVGTSLTLALLCCAVCILFGTGVAYLKVRKGRHITRMIETGASLTFALPGIVLSLAMIFYWTAIPNVYGTMRILVIAYITRYLILQVKGSTTAILSVHPELEEAATVSGSRGVRTWKKVLIPLLKSQVLSSSFLIFTSALTELTLSSLLSAAGTKTIGLTIFNFQQSGDYNLAQAMSTLTVLGIFLLFIVAKAIESTSKGATNYGTKH